MKLLSQHQIEKFSKLQLKGKNKVNANILSPFKKKINKKSDPRSENLVFKRSLQIPIFSHIGSLCIS